MNIAIFADVHGRIQLAFKLCIRWEKETGQKIDLILQAGDLGAFPEEMRLDKATIKYAQLDSTELGFMRDFAQYNANTASLLAQTHCNLIFVRGNHEDHHWLDGLEQQTDLPLFPIDAYQRVFCLKSGIPYTFSVDAKTITVFGIGRIGAPESEPEAEQPKYIQSYERKRIYNLLANHEKPPIDVLLTHDARPDFIIPSHGFKIKAGRGMAEIGLILEACKPAYHFFGHYGGTCTTGTDDNGVTYSCKLADLHWDKSDPGMLLEAGSMGILHWKSQDEHTFEEVEAAWMREYSAYTWQYM